MRRALLLLVLLLYSTAASANPTMDPYVAGTFNQVNSTNSITVTIPTAAQGWHVGDCMAILCVTTTTQANSMAVGGWNFDSSNNSGTTFPSYVSYYKQAGPGDLGSTVTCSYTGTAGVMTAVVFGVQQSTQSAGCMYDSGTNRGGTATPQTAATFAAGLGNDLNVAILINTSLTSVTWTHMNNSFFGSMTDWASNGFGYVASVPQAAPTTTGVSSSTMSSSQYNVAIGYLFLKQSAATPTPSATPTPKGQRSMFVE